MYATDSTDQERRRGGGGIDRPQASWTGTAGQGHNDLDDALVLGRRDDDADDDGEPEAAGDACDQDDPEAPVDRGCDVAAVPTRDLEGVDTDGSAPCVPGKGQPTNLHAFAVHRPPPTPRGSQSGSPETDDTDGSSDSPLTGDPAGRRRFHSLEAAAACSGGRVDMGECAATGYRRLESPTANRRSNVSPSCANLSPAQLLRHRQRRRTQSDCVAKRHPGLRRLGSGREWMATAAMSERWSHLQDAEEAKANDTGSTHRSSLPSDTDGDWARPQRWKTRPHRSDSEASNESSLSSSSLYSNGLSHSYGSMDTYEPPSMEKLQNLQILYQEGFITVTEYKNRRLQLVDEETVFDRTIKKTTDLIQTDLPVIHREPPDFTLLRERDAIKHVFDSDKRKWTSSRIQVKIDPQPFARGGLRQVFHLQDLSVIPQWGVDGRPVSYVAKIAIDPNEDPDTYFRDVEMQAVASKFANLYNTYNPPRRVEFLEAWILQLVPSNDDVGGAENLTMRGTICGVEPYIAGEYHKHNNNYGYVSELERNTPQAFSHFTFEASGRQMLIVDIQGVADHYTDPQIHTRSGKEFGKGNLSLRGFARFLESHRCNPICRYLKLELINPREDADEDSGHPKSDPKGTVPAQTYMSQPHVRVKRVDSELCHYYGDSNAFKKYQSNRTNHAQDSGNVHTFVQTLREQRNCSSYCGVGSCTLS